LIWLDGAAQFNSGQRDNCHVGDWDNLEAEATLSPFVRNNNT
jgi:hypothetical protein